MPNKRKVKNSFYFFMKEKQEEFSRKGIVYNMKQMSEIAHPLWKQLSLAQKQKYEQMAKGFKSEYQASGRMASDGTLIAENERAEEEKEEIERRMRQEITEMVMVPGASKEHFKEINSRKKFHFLAFNNLCCVQCVDPHDPHKSWFIYIPNEVGIVEYSIKDGILGEYHKFICPGPIPKGYTGDAKRHSEDTHKIPLSGHKDGERDYSKILKEIIDFITCRTDEPLAVFCLKDHMGQTQGSLDWLAKNADTLDEADNVKVYDASYLLLELRRGVEIETASYHVAEHYLKKNAFDYVPGTRCSFHEDLDSAYCALGYAKRVSFLFSDAICSLFDVEPTLNHLPPRSTADKVYEVHLPSPPSALSLERGIGRGYPKGRDNLQSEMESMSLYDRVHATGSERTDSRLHERIEPNRYMGTTPTRSSHVEAKISARDSDSENSPPSSSMGTRSSSYSPSLSSDVNSTTELRQPATASIALSLALAGREVPAVVPGKGIGRGQRKLQ